VGTAQPYSKQREHRYDNAIVKIDLRSTPDVNPTFGQVVDAYKGDFDSYVPGLSRQPVCDIAGDTVQYHPSGFSVACVQFDIDFGASPTMWRNSTGELMVGELQKSGTFHAVYADTMQSAWKTIVSTLPPATGGNVSSAANDGENVYVMANPGVVYSLDADTGATNWVTPLAVGTLENHPVQVANGVVYVMLNSLHVYGLDAKTGQPLWITNAGIDSSTLCSQPSGGGIAIAQHTVVVNCDGTLVAYRLPTP
jgi:outer membrane protein assembly factor BamB